MTAVNDYRVLAPQQITDPNGNRAAVAFDELGVPVRMALMGKLGAGEGDTLADPTTQFDYDLPAYQMAGAPNFITSRPASSTVPERRSGRGLLAEKRAAQVSEDHADTPRRFTWIRRAAGSSRSSTPGSTSACRRARPRRKRIGTNHRA